MKVKALKVIVTSDNRGVIKVGEEFEAPKSWAEKLIELGKAEKVEAPKKEKTEKVVRETKEEKLPKEDK